MGCANDYVVARVVKMDGTCEQFEQVPFEHMIILGADTDVCFTSGKRKLIIDLKDVRYIKIKHMQYNKGV